MHKIIVYNPNYLNQGSTKSSYVFSVIRKGNKLLEPRINHSRIDLICQNKMIVYLYDHWLFGPRYN
jgi:hypothetical protein